MHAPPLHYLYTHASYLVKLFNDKSGEGWRVKTTGIYMLRYYKVILLGIVNVMQPIADLIHACLMISLSLFRRINMNRIFMCCKIFKIIYVSGGIHSHNIMQNEPCRICK